MKGQRDIAWLIVAAGLLAYLNSFAGPFIFDDAQSIQENPTIRHLWPIWQTLSPPAAVGVGGRPVVNLSLAINYAFGGMGVWGYHALNLTVHILSALVLFGVVRRTWLWPVFRERFVTTGCYLAVVIAVIWAVHPLQTEAVTYVTQRAELLMGLFYLLTLYCFIRGAEPQGSGAWFALSVVVCALGMASKEVMVSAPLIVLLYDRTFVAVSFRDAWRRRWPLYAGLAGTWLLLGYLMTDIHSRGIGYDLGITWWAYALTECRVIVHYLWLAVWPHPLVFDYGGAEIIIRQPAEAAPYALILLLLVAATAVGLKRRSTLGFVGACFFGILAPVSSVVPVANQPMAEHRMYLPLAAVVVLVVLGVQALLGRRTVVVVVLAIGLGFLTVRRNEDYRSEFAIWEDTVAKRPKNGRAHYNLGVVLQQVGRVQDAIGQYEQALRLKPEMVEAHNNLGKALLAVGRVSDAIEQYELALRLKPDSAETHYDLAVALRQAGEIEDAIGHYKRAVSIDPDYLEAHSNLGIVLWQEGKLDDAIEQFGQALRVKPDSAETHNNLGVALAMKGSTEEAIAHFSAALRIRPDFMDAARNLQAAYEVQRNPKKSSSSPIEVK